MQFTLVSGNGIQPNVFIPMRILTPHVGTVNRSVRNAVISVLAPRFFFLLKQGDDFMGSP